MSGVLSVLAEWNIAAGMRGTLFQLLCSDHVVVRSSIGSL